MEHSDVPLFLTFINKLTAKLNLLTYSLLTIVISSLLGILRPGWHIVHQQWTYLVWNLLKTRGVLTMGFLLFVYGCVHFFLDDLSVHLSLLSGTITKILFWYELFRCFKQVFLNFFFSWNTILTFKSIFLALTTNERLNLERYKFFYDKDGKYHNPYK